MIQPEPEESTHGYPLVSVEVLRIFKDGGEGPRMTSRLSLKNDMPLRDKARGAGFVWERVVEVMGSSGDSGEVVRSGEKGNCSPGPVQYNFELLAEKAPGVAV
nr:hypothetical protein [Tanacetum cinerariifolium]